MKVRMKTSLLACAFCLILSAPMLARVGEPPAGAAPDQTWEAISAPFGGSKSDTKPSRDSTMNFPFPTQVSEVKVVGGQHVKKGDLLLRAQDADVVAAMEQQRLMAENTLEIQGAEAALELANIKFEALKKSGTYSQSEYDEARIQAQTSLVQRDQAKFNLQQQKERLKQLEGQYEHYRLVAQFDGIVDRVMVDVGMGVSENDKIIRVVNTDLLWLDAFPRTAETISLDLKAGSRAWVLIDTPGRPRLVDGHVVEVSPVADSVSLTRRIRVEVENPAGWPAGMLARVRFSEPSAEWNAYRPPGSDTQRSATDPAPGGTTPASGTLVGGSHP